MRIVSTLLVSILLSQSVDTFCPSEPGSSIHPPSTGWGWSHWRGPSQTGVSPDKDLPDRWSPDPNEKDNNLIWKAPYGGRSTPLVMNRRVYIINGAGEGLTQQERVMCFDADTGKVLWEHKFNVFFTDIVAVRLGWTNLAGDPQTGNVYAHGTQGLFFCFDKDGKILWSRSLTEEYGRISGYGGRVTTPTVAGNLVIVGMLNSSWGNQARGGNRFVAMDKKTGDVVWWASTGYLPRDTYYSVPVVAHINGQCLLISGGGDGGVHAFKLNTGEKVWSYIFAAGGVNCSPVVQGNRIFIGHGEENLDNNKQGRVICLDAAKVKDGKPTLVWDRPGLKIKYSSPLLHENRLYVCDENAIMYCLDAANGKQIWKFKYGRNAKGAPVLADGKIYVGEVNSKFHILKPGPKKCEELHVQFFPSPDGTSDVEINGSPAVAYQRVYFMTRDELFCIGKSKNPRPEVHPAGGNAVNGAVGVKVAHLQILPADVVLEPGESVSFHVEPFDAQGNRNHFLGEGPGGNASWSLGAAPPPEIPIGAPPVPKPKGPQPAPPMLKGKIIAGKNLSDPARLTVDPMVPAQFGTVMFKAHGQTATARVRVAPKLPYRQDFEKVPDGRTPAGWVNCQGKFAVETKDGSKVLKKLANNASPLLARANAYIGKPTLTDYTIQSDVMGARKRQDMPDAGVVANRYTLMLDGTKQRLRLHTWDALPRIDKTIEWPWKPEVWYTLKLTVVIEGDKAIARGKAWPRGESEPEAWTIEIEDPLPNREGSPALYGYATGIINDEIGAEIFYDNVSVTPNKK